ncbi:sulfite exporter TauE/SafE family protein [Ramlibacter sp. WS9]|uniref:sulfite exporter TauE/SafE family protein n=1 Tax=Ramlibacter sp. WS9 TaxID=1882741 RepID=UPI0011432E15|nr:sulfite exporter TauE/SafE family protein [Ramlibacter sp. WS9]ROZ78768.1 sulfite exporter TauE/SafE family protein [Ramlibacter sp. WS9]
MDYALVLLVGLFGGTLGGIVGTGSSIVLMPVLVGAWGPVEAVPVMAIAAFMGNFGRVVAWRREVDWRIAGAFCLTALPAAVLGVRTLLTVPASWVEVALGFFFLAMVPARRWLKHRGLRVSWVGVMLIGAPLGFLTGIVVSTGPLKVPLFTAYGLERGGLLGTEALASLAVYATKLFTFASMDALPAAVVLKGLIAGAALMCGAFLGKHVVLRLSPHAFGVIVDALMVVSGLVLLALAYQDLAFVSVFGAAADLAAALAFS